jgi:hypothetical protein
MIGYFACMEVSCLMFVGHGASFSLFFLLTPGLSPSVHFIDQIKIIDRFRGEFSHFHFVIRGPSLTLVFLQKFHTTGQWQT